MVSSTTEWFTTSELAHIKARALHYAFKLKRRVFFHDESVQDLQQDLILAVIEAWKGYDEANGSIEPFVEQVLKNASISLARRHTRQKRQVSQFFTSIESVPESVLVDEEDNWAQEVEQKVDVERYLRKSPVFLRKVMVEIQNDSLRNVAKKLGISRTKLRGLVEYCQQALAPLKEFVGGESFLGLRIRRFSCASH
jgi:RNA polymerase sigma factor (sigma-70 family)